MCLRKFSSNQKKREEKKNKYNTPSKTTGKHLEPNTSKTQNHTAKIKPSLSLNTKSSRHCRTQTLTLNPANTNLKPYASRFIHQPTTPHNTATLDPCKQPRTPQIKHTKQHCKPRPHHTEKPQNQSKPNLDSWIFELFVNPVAELGASSTKLQFYFSSSLIKRLAFFATQTKIVLTLNFSSLHFSSIPPLHHHRFSPSNLFTWI